MIEVKVKEWGNSMGIIIPKEVIEEFNIKPGEKILVEIEKKNPLKELFGSLKFTKSTEELLKETKKELESKWL